MASNPTSFDVPMGSQVKALARAAGATHKPGYKTTEFWITVAENTVGAVLASGLLTENWMLQLGGVIMMIIGSLKYKKGRQELKNAQSQNK